MRKRLKVLRISSMALALCALAGCMQIETRVKLEADGSATIVERIRFSHRLLDMKLEGSPVADMNALLEKPQAEQRAKQFGEGCQLTSHEVKAVRGGKEAVSIYKISDLNKFQYASPYLAYLDYAENNVIRFKLEPVYKSRPYAGAKAGQMSVSIAYQKAPKGLPAPEKDKPLPPGPAPVEQQVYRELIPAIRDMLDGFELRLTFEPYTHITHSGLYLRNRQAKPREIDLLWFNDKHLGKYGDSFMNNEEVMLGLARLNFGDAEIADQVGGGASNDTLPVFHAYGSPFMRWSPGSEIAFAPSRPLFDKLFEGKELNYNEWQEKPTDKKVKAEFEKIGAKE